MRCRRIGLSDSTGALPADFHPNHLPDLALIHRARFLMLYRRSFLCLAFVSIILGGGDSARRNAAGPAGAVARGGGGGGRPSMPAGRPSMGGMTRPSMPQNRPAMGGAGMQGKPSQSRRNDPAGDAWKCDASIAAPWWRCQQAWPWRRNRRRQSAGNRRTGPGLGGGNRPGAGGGIGGGNRPGIGGPDQGSAAAIDLVQAAESAAAIGQATVGPDSAVVIGLGLAAELVAAIGRERVGRGLDSAVAIGRGPAVIAPVSVDRGSEGVIDRGLAVIAGDRWTGARRG